MSDSKKKQYIVAVHLGSVRYFMMLADRLRETYDVAFLITPKTKIKCSPLELDSMRALCAEHAFPIREIGTELKKTIPVPLVGTLAYWRAYQKSCARFFAAEPCTAIVADEDTNPFTNITLREAARAGAEARAMQWAALSDLELSSDQRTNMFKTYGNTGLLSRASLRILRTLSNLLNITAISGYVIGQGSAERVGVTSQWVKDMLVAAGVPKDRIRIIGSMEAQDAYETLRAVNQDPARRKKLQTQLRVNPAQKNVVIFTNTFSTPGVLSTMTKQEQYEYYRKLLQDVRGVLPKDTYGIHLKMHHRESRSDYAPFAEEFSVVLHDKMTDNAELVALCDLYIAHGSTANLVPIAMHKDCIFINIAQEIIFEDAKAFFGIPSFVQTHESFVSLLNNWKHGSLAPQYQKATDEKKPLELTRVFLK